MASSYTVALMRILPPGRRRLRQARVFSLRWQRRAVFVLGGAVVGVAAVLLAMAADRAGEAFQAAFSRMPLAVLLLTPLGLRGVVLAVAALLSRVPEAAASRR